MCGDGWKINLYWVIKKMSAWQNSEYLYSYKPSPYKILINYKGKGEKSYLIVEKL